MTRELTVIIEREDDGYVALGPELEHVGVQAGENLDERSRGRGGEALQARAVERPQGAKLMLGQPLDIASQGLTVNEVRNNLKEALDLFFETAYTTEIERRLTA